jgi:hypothetical protein
MDEQDLEIPEPIPMLRFRRWQKRFQRARLEITHLFDNPDVKRHALEQFEKHWRAESLRSYAVMLAYREVFRPGDPNGPLRKPSSMDPMQRRSENYQLWARYEERLEAYRRRLGLPSRNDSPAP